MESVRLLELWIDRRCGVPCARTAKGVARLIAVCVFLIAGSASSVRAQSFEVGSFTKTASTAVAFQSTATKNAAAATSVTITAFNPGAGSNRLLVVGLSFGSGAGTAIGVKYGAATMFLVPGSSVTRSTAHTEMWYLPNPSSTASNIVATWGGSHDVVMGAVAFNNVDQTTPIQNGITANATSAAPSVTISSRAGNMTMAVVGKLTSLTAATQTQRWLDTTRTNIKGGGSTAAGADTVAHGFTASSSTAWVESGVDVRQAGGQVQPPIAHTLGVVPNAMILWTETQTTSAFTTDSISGFGVTDGTTSRSVSGASQNGVGTSNTSRRGADKVLTIVQWGQVTLAEADLTSWDAANVNLTWTTNDPSAYVIHYLILGGSSVSAKVVDWTATASGSLIDKSVTGVGFQPNAVLHFMAGDPAAVPSSIASSVFMLGVMDPDDQWVTATYASDGVGTSATSRGQLTNASAQPACILELTQTQTVQMKAHYVSMDSDGFTVHFDTNTDGPDHIFSLAIAGMNIKPGVFLKTTGDATPTFVQQAARSVTTAANVQAFGASNTAGNLIVVTASFDGARTISSLADTRGNTYTLAVGPTNWGPGSIYHTSTYYASNVGGGANTITATLTGAPTSFFELYQLEYSGVSTVSPLDQVASAAGTSAVWNSGAKTTTQANELVYGYGAGQSGTGVKGATYAARSTFDSNIAEDKNVSAMGSYSADGSFPGSTMWVAQMATFQGNVQSVTGGEFKPSAILFASAQDLTRAAPVAHARLGIGASDGTTDGSSASADQNAVGTTAVQSIDKTTKAFMKVDNTASTIDAEADLVSFDSDGFTLNWTTNDGVATEILYLALAPLSATEVRLTSFAAAKYSRGTLVQWQTGYEIDNIGFNVYREINGVRTKLNAALIAGSGLQSGQGGVAAAEHAYARWDLDAAALDPTAVYWLEDVEFNGKSTMHGPITPTVSQLQEPATVNSNDLSDLGAATARQIFFAYNPDADLAGPSAVAPQTPAEVTQQWALAAQPTVKIGIQKPGWYRVTRDELVAGGLAAQVDPRTLQLFVNGVEQAIRVVTATDGVFTSGDTVEFYGAGVDTPYTDTRIYWLQAGSQPGRRIATAARESSALSATTSFASAVRRKDRSLYSAAIMNGDADNWFGPTVSPQPVVPDPDNPWSAVSLTLTPDHLDRSAVTGAQLTVAVQGATTAADGNSSHVVGVRVNGHDVGVLTFVGQAHAEQTFPVALDQLLDGVNTVALDARGGNADISLTDAITLTYPHTYQADADRLKFTIEAPGTIAVGGFAGTAIRVFDIKDRTTPVELPATVTTAADLSTVTVNVPGSGTRTLMAFSDETVASPLFIQANRPSTLHAISNASDYVIVSHADFLAQVAPLAALRQRQGHSTAVIDVADVYDEFNFGEKTPQALRDFLQWASTHWTTAPKFVVLAGDATIDPRDYQGYGDADFVPTKQVPMNLVSLETASDDWFVDFRDNGLPNVAIGRLSVRTAAQAHDVVAKIVGYDQIGTAAWTKDVLLVADLNDATTNFERASNALSALVPSDYRVHTAFRGALGDAGARQAITDAVTNGQLVVDYNGHGSTQFWGSGGSELLTNAEVPSWTNAARLPFVVAMNCLNGLFNGIYGEDSLAEALLRAPNGGAAAVWASSSVTDAETQTLVNQELFRLIFGGTYATVGEAVAMAKRVVSSPDLRRSWIFFGDPAMRLSGAPQAATQSLLGPPPVIATQPLSVAIAAGQHASLNVVATGTAPLGYQWYSRSARTSMSPIAGATARTYATPALTDTISYMVRVSSPTGSTDSAVAAVSTPPAIATASPWPMATVRSVYSLVLTATNGAPPYQWSATGLPSGLQLDAASGEIFDAPNGAGTFTFDIRATGVDGISTHRTFSLTVRAATDDLVNQQWHLRDRAIEAASADVEPAWSLSRGAGVVIGIVDDGVQGTHPDLQANYLATLSYDFRNHDVDASPVTTGVCGLSADCQGTAVAGIAAARGDNGFGGSGVAPLASIAGIRIAPDLADVDEAAAFAYQWNAVPIENHSWHRADDGQTLAAPGPLAEAALASATSLGRSGAGRIFVWAAGDGGANGDNCNYDGYANSRFGIAVGAVDDTGHQAPYSEPCSALLVSAPSSGIPGVNRSLTTTDLLDVDGYDAGDYTNAFGGTAAAAPVVSGVVALMLARNPALTWRDVQHILVRSSRQMDASDASWTSGPFPHSEKYGFGVVDALAAATTAATWANVSAERAVRAVTHTVNAAIPDDNRAGVSDGINIGNENAGFSIEHVEVEFTATHPHRGDLEVTLTSPAGIVSHLGTARPGDGGADFAAWRFRSVRHWGESPVGLWTLTVADRAAGNIGIFTGWTLRIYGTSIQNGTTVMISAGVPSGPAPPTATVAAGATSTTTPAVGAPIVATASAKGANAAPASRAIVAVPVSPKSALGASLVPASDPLVPTNAGLPVEATAAVPDQATLNADVSAGRFTGIYGSAPEPEGSVPESERPAVAVSPNGEGGKGGTTPPVPEPTPTSTPEPETGPGAPSDLVASVTGSTIVLKWKRATSGSAPTGYILEAGSTSGRSNLFASPTGGVAVSFTAKDAGAGTYFVRVRASNARGTSDSSNEATVVVGAGDSISCTAPPSVPRGLRFSVAGTSVVLGWDAARFGPTSYIVETASTSGANSRAVTDTHSAATTLTVDGVTPGSYAVRVRARNACGGSALSNSMTIVVP